MKDPISLSPLGDLKAAGYRLIGNCGNPACGRGRWLNIDALIEKFGAGYEVVGEARIARSLKCDGCGHKGGRLTLSPPP